MGETRVSVPPLHDEQATCSAQSYRVGSCRGPTRSYASSYLQATSIRAPDALGAKETCAPVKPRSGSMWKQKRGKLKAVMGSIKPRGAKVIAGGGLRSLSLESEIEATNGRIVDAEHSQVSDWGLSRHFRIWR
jgi:hypothetical protein